MIKKLLFIIILFVFNISHACELLVLNRTDLQADSKWEKYDIVVIQDDGAEWGREELNKKKFLIVKLIGVDKAEINIYLSTLVKEEIIDGIPTGKNIKMRKYKIDTTRLTAEQITKLENSELQLTKVILNSAMKVKNLADYLP